MVDGEDGDLGINQLCSAWLGMKVRSWQRGILSRSWTQGIYFHFLLTSTQLVSKFRNVALSDLIWLKERLLTLGST